MESIRPLNNLVRRTAARPQCLRSIPRSAVVHRLHTSLPKAATPYPIPEVLSSPPPPPEPIPSESENRLARRKKQAELLERARTLRPNPARPATALQKRFWKSASVKETPEGLEVHLDTRPVRTRDKKILLLPTGKHQLATAIALEWDLLVSAQQALKQHYIPLTALVSRAIDIEAADSAGDTRVRDGILNMVLRYLHTDTLLCWAPERDLHQSMTREGSGHGESLREVQMKVATPIISYLTTRVWPGVEINPVLDPDSILPTPQPDMTQEVIKGWIYGLKPYELAGLERAVLATKSILIAARMVVEWSPEFSALREGAAEERFGIEDAAQACSIEVEWQTSMWGEVEDTHDVEKEDVRRQLGGVVLLINGQA